jgi:hypothetical protein
MPDRHGGVQQCSLLGESGIILPQGMMPITQGLPAILKEESDDLPAVFR